MEKYDAYASKPVKGIMKRHHIELSVKVIEGLKGDALKCAMDLGSDVVVAQDAGDQSLMGWQAGNRHEGLHRDCGKQDGVLARVTEESMASYVSRRCRWYRSMTTLDNTFRTPEHFQLEMMMDCASIIDHMQQLARLAATKPLTLETMHGSR